MTSKKWSQSNRPHRGKKWEERRGREREKRARRQREDPRLIAVRVFFIQPHRIGIIVSYGALQPIGCAHSPSPEHRFPRPYLNIGMSERSDTVETLVVCREVCSATLFYDHTAVVYVVLHVKYTQSIFCAQHTAHLSPAIPNTKSYPKSI